MSNFPNITLVLTHPCSNILKEDPSAYTKPEDLVTPTLKSDTYTTGRGGTGNMARNDPANPEIARLAQDVDAPAHIETQPKHGGRGGAGNFLGQETQQQQQHNKSGDAKPSSSDLNRTTTHDGEAKRDEGAASKGLLGKGKDLLNKLKK